MIDTDKYEGHTEDIERWQGLSNSLPHWSNESDKHLMRDAPLLFEEIKRLREENKELEEFLNESHASNKIWHERLIRAQKWAYKQVCHNDSAMMDYDDYVWGEDE